jgi:hypothetical protein
MRDIIKRLWPGIDWIADLQLLEQVTQTWSKALERSPLTADDLNQIPFTLLVPNCPSRPVRQLRWLPRQVRRGSLGFALADSIYADHVIVVTDNLGPFPCVPWQIQGNNMDYVVEVDSIGDASKIVSGTTQITRSPDRLRIAEFVARFPARCGHHA